MAVGKTEHQIRTEERRDITPFEQYMHMHQLEALSVSAQIRVRYFVLWRAVKGKPINFEQARTIRAGVGELTGVPYMGPGNCTDTGTE